MANALGGAAQNLPIANNLQASSVNQTNQQQEQIRQSEQQDEGRRSQSLRTQEEQRTNETTEFRADNQEENNSVQTASSQGSSSVPASGQDRGSNVDILV